MNPDRNLFETIVKADNASSRLRPGQDDYVQVQRLLDRMKARMPEAMRVGMDIVRALTTAGISAAKAGYFDESRQWFALAANASAAEDPACRAAFCSCTASAEAFLHWRTGAHELARERLESALTDDLYLERTHGWSFLLPQRLHYSHLLARSWLAEQRIDEAYRCLLPGANNPGFIPDMADIATHFESYPEDREMLTAALRRMAGEIAIVDCILPDISRQRVPLVRERIRGTLAAGAFEETLELLLCHEEPGRLDTILRRGRGKSIAWYAAVHHAVVMMQEPALRRAVAARMARWSDIPAPIRQAILTLATAAGPAAGSC